MIEPITSERTHQHALRRIEELWDAAPGSAEEQELDALATLVDAYERKQFPISPLDPATAIKVRCEDLGWTRKDLEPILGSRARVSEILGGKRPLTLEMIRKVHAAMHIPLEVLIAPVAPRRRTPARNVRRKTSKRSVPLLTRRRGASAG